MFKITFKNNKRKWVDYYRLVSTSLLYEENGGWVEITKLTKDTNPQDYLRKLYSKKGYKNIKVEEVNEDYENDTDK